MNTAREKAIDMIGKQGGIIRTREALRQGIRRRTLYGLYAKGMPLPVVQTTRDIDFIGLGSKDISAVGASIS